jgi:hypothetical protein
MLRPGRICWRAFAVLLLTYFPLQAFSQTAAEWKPVPAEELSLKDDPGMPGAAALLLDRDSHVDDEKSFQTEYYRIKILKDEGRRFADVEIPYVPKVLEVSEIKARKVRPDGTAAEFQGEIFDRFIIKSRHFKYQAKQLNLPDVHPGDIIEYSYRMSRHQHVPDVLKHPEAYLITDAYSIPTVHWKIQHELFTRHARFSIRPIPKANLRWTLVRAPSGTEVKRQEDGSYVLEVRNIPPLAVENSHRQKITSTAVFTFFLASGLFLLVVTEHGTGSPWRGAKLKTLKNLSDARKRSSARRPRLFPPTTRKKPS